MGPRGAKPRAARGPKRAQGRPRRHDGMGPRRPKTLVKMQVLRPRRHDGMGYRRTKTKGRKGPKRAAEGPRAGQKARRHGGQEAQHLVKMHVLRPRKHDGMEHRRPKAKGRKETQEGRRGAQGRPRAGPGGPTPS